MEQANNEILDRLIGEQQAPQVRETIKEDDNNVLITTSRVVSIRYRIYFLLLLLIGGGLTYYAFLPAWNGFQSTRTQLAGIRQQVADFATRKATMEADKALITKVQSQESLVVSCLNDKIACKEIDPAIRDNFSFVRSYLQLNNLTSPKMAINQKVLLANINEYLLKGANATKNGKLSNITIGESKIFTGNLYTLPIKLTISFDTKDDLLSFIDNVEKKIVSDPTYRVLYKIDKVSYDITNYTSKQRVDIELFAYYYTE